MNTDLSAINLTDRSFCNQT